MNTLSLCEALLQRGQQLLRWHQLRQAQQQFAQLFALGDVTRTFQAHYSLAEWADEQQLLRRACWHWRAAWKLQPTNADVCYRYARALDADGEALPKAWRMIRRALKADRTKPEYWTLYAQIALRLQHDRIALRAFRHVLRQSDVPTALLAEALEGLRTLGQSRDARQRLLDVRFQHPHDLQLQQLWDDWQRADTQASQSLTDEPAVLPFPATPITNERIVRHDAHSAGQPHVFRLPQQRRPKYRGS